MCTWTEVSDLSYEPKIELNHWVLEVSTIKVSYLLGCKITIVFKKEV
jgi:hypothetical protein